MRLLILLFSLLVCLSAAAAPAEVLTSIRPLALIAREVAGEQGVVRQLVPNGASSHDYQLRPSDRLLLSRADILLWVGPAHETFLVRTVAASQAQVLTAQNLPDIHLRMQRRLDGGAAIAGSVDPHLWLDPDNAVVIAQALAEALARHDPAHSLQYWRNANAFASRLTALKAAQTARFQRLPSHAFIAYHDAYQYLEPLLGLNFRGSLLAGDESKPSAKHFLWLSQTIHQEKITCLLAEPGFDEALARNVFAGQPSRRVMVDELFVSTTTQGITRDTIQATTYEAGLAQMIDGIYSCLL